ncbi:hypothetical protein HCUR_01177 [Holospora curviuscula]|uniref:Uncharacterized protein n=1 Tax=Holospora curviuscula TaxID=1082868 RepID=A0A2S5R7V9_9PROT|nr:hypothetical protein HCUR_01177 [Holospora curviuscula]
MLVLSVKYKKGKKMNKLMFSVFAFVISGTAFAEESGCCTKVIHPSACCAPTVEPIPTVYRIPLKCPT